MAQDSMPRQGDLKAHTSANEHGVTVDKENVAIDHSRRVAAAPIMPTGEEPEEVDVTQFYVRTEDLVPCASPKAEAAALVEQLDSATWTVACAALLNARRLAVHNREDLTGVLEAVLPRLKNHINSLRSSLCKTALICAADFFMAYGDDMFPHLPVGSPSLLGTLLHKAALEKRFVMDEAKRTLATVIKFNSSDSLLPLLLLHVSEMNPKVRAVVAKCVVDTVDKALAESGAGAQCCVQVESEELLRAAAIFINDRLPMARENARKLMNQLRGTCAEDTNPDGWNQFVEKVLGKAAAVKICKM